MNKIYFARKGCTVTAKCPNLFPIKDKDFYKAPPELFDDCELMLYITPKMIDQSFFMAHFVVYNCYFKRFENYGGGLRNFTKVVLSAALRERRLNVNCYSHKEEDYNDYMFHELLESNRKASMLLEEGIVMFNEYFPYQTHGGRKYYERFTQKNAV